MHTNKNNQISRLTEAVRGSLPLISLRWSVWFVDKILLNSFSDFVKKKKSCRRHRCRRHPPESEIKRQPKENKIVCDNFRWIRMMWKREKENCYTLINRPGSVSVLGFSLFSFVWLLESKTVLWNWHLFFLENRHIGIFIWVHHHFQLDADVNLSLLARQSRQFWGCTYSAHKSTEL